MSVQPFKALDAVTGVGPGPTTDLQDVYGTFTLAALVTGSPSTVTVLVEVSLDGVNWKQDPVGAGNLVTGSSAYQWNFSSFGGVARYVRLNVTALSGGTSPTVTAWLALRN